MLDTDIARDLLNASTLGLSLRRPDTPRGISLPWSLGGITSQGIVVTFSCKQSGSLAVSLILGSEQLTDTETGKDPLPVKVCLAFPQGLW